MRNSPRKPVRLAADVAVADCIAPGIRASPAVPSASWILPTHSGFRFVVPIAAGGPRPVRSVFWDDGFISVW